MKIQIYAEDAHCEALAVLARKALQQADSGAFRPPVVSAVRRKPHDMQREMLTLVRGAYRDGYHHIIFAIDRESEWSRERPELIAGICRTFAQLCGELPNHPERDARVALVIVNRCLESWLLADVDGLLDYARGPKGLRRFTGSSFRSGQTEGVDKPDRRISALFAETAKDTGSSRPKRCEKSNLKAIAQFVDPERAQTNNRSLAYFLEMVTGQGDGCSHPYQQEQCTQARKMARTTID